jgi:hypothetical protein
MASINDVFTELTQVNSNLGLIHADGIAETNAINQVKASVDHLDSDVKAGFTATINALGVIAQVEVESAKLLYHLTQQADAMICALEHIAKNTCGIWNEAVLQTTIEARIRDDADVLRSIQEFAHPDATLEMTRLAALKADVERCCPPPKPQLPCDYRPCPSVRTAEPPNLPKPGDNTNPKIG